MNHVTIIGRLTADPQVRYTQEGTAVASFTIAIDRGKDKGADFPRVVAFGKTAENVGKYTEKGKRVAVEGSIHTGSYDRNGEKVYTTDVNAFRVEFLDWKEKTAKNENMGFQGFEEIIDADLPF